jgi:hypothetical protein
MEEVIMSQLNKALFLTILFILASCGGDKVDGGEVSFHNVRAEVTGLNGSLILSTNGKLTTVSEDQSESQLTLLEEGVVYNVITVLQPVGQQCSINDGSGVVGQADININVNCENIEYTIKGYVSGLINEIVLSIDEEQGGSNLAIDADGVFDSERVYIHGDNYSISIATQPTGQICAIFNGSGTFDVAYMANIAVTCDNTPIALAGSKTTNQDVGFSSILESEVINVNNQKFAITAQPASGLISLDDASTGDYTYIPAENYFGEVSFNFNVNDGTETSSEATVSITINTINDAPATSNDAPVTSNLSVNVAVNQTILVSAGFDVDGDVLTLIFKSSPTKGKVVYSVESGEYTYTPGDTGEDRFTFTLSDSKGGISEEAEHHFNVLPVADLSETAGNNNKVDATRHYQKSTITGGLSDASDVDWYRFDAFADGSVQLDFSSLISEDNEPFNIFVENSSGDDLVSTLAGNDAILRFSVIDGASYFIRIEDVGAMNAVEVDYAVSLEYYPSAIATLSWSAPTLNVDESPYDNRKGYMIYYGTSESQLTETFYLADPNAQSDVSAPRLEQKIQNLRLGTLYYFAITAINDSDIESEYSNMVTKTFP